MPFELFAFFTGTVFAESESLVEYVLPQDDFADPNLSGDLLKQQLWQAEITPVEDTKNPEQKDELKRLIEQIRAIKVSSQEQTSSGQVTPDTTVIAEPNEAPHIKDVPEIQKKVLSPELPYTPISEETLQKLKNLSQDPRKINNPFELAEILFRNGNYKEAALFYQEALNRTTSNGMKSSVDRAWLIFQAGNCLRNHDMAEAAKMYSRLVTEYPGSIWADIAMIQNQLITWYQKDNPERLISDSKQKKSG